MIEVDLKWRIGAVGLLLWSLAPVASVLQSWYGPGVRRIETFSKHDVRDDDRTMALYPLAIELDSERNETTVWLYVGSEEKEGKKRLFCPRGATLRDGVRENRLILTRLEATTVVKKKDRGDCLEVTSLGERVAASAKAVYDLIGEARLKKAEKRQTQPGQLGLVFLGLPDRRAPYLAVVLPIGEEILFYTRDVH
jgi:hypothetical protein